MSIAIDSLHRRAVLTALPNASGADSVSITVTDPDGLTATAVLPVAVDAVNDAPRIATRDPLYPVLGTDGVTVPLSELIEDVDDPVEALQVLHPTEGGLAVALSDDGRHLEVRGTSAGRGIVRLLVEDAAGAQASGRQVAVVLAPGESVPPELASLPTLRFYGGSVGALSLSSLVRDDGPLAQLQWTAVADSGLSNPLVTDGALAVAAEPGFVGPSSLQLTVRDADGNEDSAELAVEVLDVADAAAPLINAPAKIGLVAGGAPHSLSLDPLVDDPDHGVDRLAWSASASHDLDEALDPGARTLALSAPEGVSGLRAVTLTATDPQGLADTVTVPVLVAEAGGVPMVAPMAKAVLESVGTEARIDLDDAVFDADDRESELYWTAVAEPGIDVDLDPVTHLLRVERVEDGLQPPPLTSTVVLTVEDTEGKKAAVTLEVSLPPVFELSPIPAVSFYTGEVDTTLDLDEFVAASDPVALDWAAAPSENLNATVDTVSHRVRLAARHSGYVGTETLLLTATDATGRSRSAQVQVTVQGRGLTPQMRAFGQLQVLAGQEDRSIVLDEYAVDDDPDSLLVWTATQPAGLSLEIGPPGNTLSVTAQASAAGPNQVQLLVRDPAGNVASGRLEVLVLLGGEPPIIDGLPQLLVAAGGDEVALSLDLYVQDADTPVDQLAWDVSAEPGVTARVVDRRLLVSVPAGEAGSRHLVLTAVDPEGNQDEENLTVLIESDDQAPAFTVQVKRNPATSDVLELVVTADEALAEAPSVELAGEAVEAVPLQDNSYQATYAVPPAGGSQLLTVRLRGTDRAGNEGEHETVLVLRWITEAGGSLTSTDGLASVNVPNAAPGPGKLATLRRLDEGEAPDEDDRQPVYEAATSSRGELAQPAMLNLFAGSQVAEGVGIQRWDPAAEAWEELPTAVDEDTGWLSTPMERDGLYRLGPVEAANRRVAETLTNYPNPFPSTDSAETTIEYILTVAGPVRLEVINVLGQRVRVLVDDEVQSVGTWTARWDGRDAGGQRLANGVYFYQLGQGGAVRTRALLLMR